MSARTARKGVTAGVDGSAARLLQRIPWLSDDGIAIVQRDGSPRVAWANPALHALLGAAPGSLAGADLASLPRATVAPGETGAAPGAPGHLDLDALGDASAPVCCRLTRLDGETIDVSISARPLEGLPLGALAVTVRAVPQRALELLPDLTTTEGLDVLTGLPNLRQAREDIDAALARRCDAEVAVLCVDLDDFKLVNDSHGHHAGDELLREVARRLRAATGPGQLVARLGADAFIVALDEVREAAEALLVAHRLLVVVRRPTVVAERELRASVSIGVAVSDPSTSVDDLLRDADLAMHQAKREGKARVAVFDEGQRVVARARLDLITALRSALASGEVGLHYQAVMDLATGRIVGAEALLRFRHPDQGLVPATEVIALAEDSGCIVELGSLVLRLATQQLAAWRRDGKGPDYVAVNLGAHQLIEPDLPEVVLAALRDADLMPQDLCIELTESHVIAEDDRARATLKSLDQLGVQLAIDDFGAGYSSLSYLRRIPAQTIKIDRSFIKGVDVEPEAVAIVEAITALGRALNRTIVAEGVETPAQLRAVHAIGCDLVQGYLLSRPVHPHAFPEEIQLPD